jgi:hypothetical protein
VVVDQFEELFTQTSREQRARFAQLLHPALGGPVQVVTTLRSEFLDQLLADADLAVLSTRHYPLRPLHREALRAVIQGPSQRAGIAVNDDLVARLVADTDSGEALPLLAFTLSQLAEGVSRGGQLSTARYDQLGRVQGALARQADTALSEARAASGRGREEVIAGLLRLVTVCGDCRCCLRYPNSGTISHLCVGRRTPLGAYPTWSQVPHQVRRRVTHRNRWTEIYCFDLVPTVSADQR